MSKEYTEVTIKAKLIGSPDEVREIAEKIRHIADTSMAPLLDRSREDTLKVTVNEKVTYE